MGCAHSWYSKTVARKRHMVGTTGLLQETSNNAEFTLMQESETDDTNRNCKDDLKTCEHAELTQTKKQLGKSSMDALMNEILTKVESVDVKVTKLAVDIDQKAIPQLHEDIRKEYDDEKVSYLDTKLQSKLDAMIDHEFLYVLASQLRETCNTLSDSSRNRDNIAWDVLNAHIGKYADKTNIKTNIWNQLQMEIDHEQMNHENEFKLQREVNSYIDQTLLEILDHTSNKNRTQLET
eukprot:434831_1